MNFLFQILYFSVLKFPWFFFIVSIFFCCDLVFFIHQEAIFPHLGTHSFDSCLDPVWKPQHPVILGLASVDCLLPVEWACCSSPLFLVWWGTVFWAMLCWGVSEFGYTSPESADVFVMAHKLVRPKCNLCHVRPCPVLFTWGLFSSHSPASSHGPAVTHLWTKTLLYILTLGAVSPLEHRLRGLGILLLPTEI